MRTGWIVGMITAACASASAAPAKAKLQDGGTSLCPWNDWDECKSRCDAGNALSCARYAEMLYRGASRHYGDEQLEVDRAGARAAWKKSCELGYPDACATAGMVVGGDIDQDDDFEPEHKGDFGGPIDKAAANALYARACAGGVAMGCAMTGDTSRACDLGDAEACADRADAHGDDVHAALADFHRAMSGAPAKTARAAARMTCAAGTTAAETTGGLGGLGGPETLCLDAHGKKQGAYLEWLSAEDLAQGAPDGQISEQGAYKDDKRDGAWKRYRQGSAVAFEEGRYLADQKDGPWIEDRDGGDRWEGRYAHDEKTGTWTRYSDDRVAEITTYVAGKQDGDDTTTRGDGSKCTDHYAAGELQWQRCWSARGKKTMDRPYLHGAAEGVERDWYDSGKLQETGRNKAGHKTGVWTEYYESGRKRALLDYGANDDGDEFDPARTEFDDK